MITSQQLDITSVLTQEEPITGDVLRAYEAFGQHKPGWTKVALTTV